VSREYTKIRKYRTRSHAVVSGVATFMNPVVECWYG
jgi:hypothetical protein